jgi:hypothetical protein
MDSEIIDISELNMGNSGPSLKSSNFGGGLELLMNDNKKAGGRPSSDIDLDDFDCVTFFSSELVKDRTQHPAGAAPLCPEVHENGNRGVSNFGGKIGIVSEEDCFACHMDLGLNCDDRRVDGYE